MTEPQAGSDPQSMRITLGHSVIRHMLNLETVNTYEGTQDTHTLAIGGTSRA